MTTFTPYRGASAQTTDPVQSDASALPKVSVSAVESKMTPSAAPPIELPVPQPPTQTLPGIPSAPQPTTNAADAPAQAGTSPLGASIADLTGSLTAGVLWGAIVHPLYRPAYHQRPSTADSSATAPGFFLGVVPGRGRVAGGLLFAYRPAVDYSGGRTGLWYFDLQGHLLPKVGLPLGIYLAMHMGSVSWTAPSSGYTDSEFTAGFGFGIEYALIRHVTLLADYRITGLFEGTQSTYCANGGGCSSSSSDHSQFMHLFSLGVAASYF
jgi:hypothetical protein